MQEFKVGDLVEFNGRRFVINGFQDSWLCTGRFVYASPATKTGKADNRKSLQRLSVEKLILVAKSK